MVPLQGWYDTEEVFFPPDNSLHDSVHDGSGLLSGVGDGSAVELLQGSAWFDCKHLVDNPDLFRSSSDGVKEHNPQDIFAAGRYCQRALVHGLARVFPLVVELKQVLETHLFLLDLFAFRRFVLVFSHVDCVHDSLEELGWSTDVD